MRLRLLLALLLSWLLTEAAPDSLRVGIVTCAPGADIYQLEGHAALHLHGRLSDKPVDLAVNYGVFDFNAPNFVYRFVKGETDYMVDAVPWPYFLRSYQREGREVIEHPVIMDSVQTARLVELLSENLLPQNRVYRYNYVKDNCATRPLAIIEKALGDSIIIPQPAELSKDDSTFREVMRTHHKNYPWYQFGIDLALGSGIDYNITAREKTFAPTVLNEQLPGATVNGRQLTEAPQIVLLGMGSVIEPPTPWYATPLAAGCALFVLTLLISVRDLHKSRISKWFDTVLYTLFGICGLIITFLIFVSTHEGSSPNWLYLWLNPLCLIVPIFIWLKKFNNVVLSYQFINFALILGMCVAWPLTGQSGNVAFIPLIACDMLRSITYIVINLKSKRGRDVLRSYRSSR